MNPTEEKNTAKMCGLVVFSYHHFFSYSIIMKKVSNYKNCVRGGCGK